MYVDVICENMWHTHTYIYIYVSYNIYLCMCRAWSVWSMVLCMYVYMYMHNAYVLLGVYMRVSAVSSSCSALSPSSRVQCPWNLRVNGSIVGCRAVAKVIFTALARVEIKWLLPILRIFPRWNPHECCPNPAGDGHQQIAGDELSEVTKRGDGLRTALGRQSQ